MCQACNVDSKFASREDYILDTMKRLAVPLSARDLSMLTRFDHGAVAGYMRVLANTGKIKQSGPMELDRFEII